MHYLLFKLVLEYVARRIQTNSEGQSEWLNTSISLGYGLVTFDESREIIDRLDLDNDPSRQKVDNMRK